jgi:F-type H+-transporting ATPase subunit epsilon
VSGFVLHLLESTRCERIDGVTDFIGEDDSGQFGIRPGHERFMTIHVFGLARFQVSADPVEYLAVPGGLLYFVENELFLCARRLFRHRDYREVARALTEQLAVEERELQGFKRSLRQLEDEMLKRLWRIGGESPLR